MVRVPLGITPALAAPLDGVRARWQLPGDGKAVVCYAGARGMAERLSLARILAHPDVRITVLPSASETVGRLGRELLPVLLGMLTSTMTI
jgi:hypothetical protein